MKNRKHDRFNNNYRYLIYVRGTFSVISISWNWQFRAVRSSMLTDLSNTRKHPKRVTAAAVITRCAREE